MVHIFVHILVMCTHLLDGLDLEKVPCYNAEDQISLVFLTSPRTCFSVWFGSAETPKTLWFTNKHDVHFLLHANSYIICTCVYNKIFHVG